MNAIKKLLVLLCLPVSSLMAQQHYSINMRLSGFKDGTMFRLLNIDLDRFIDSGKLASGKLVFKGAVKGPVAARIHTIDGKYLVLYLENKEINITGTSADFGYSHIGGSEINKYWVQSRDAQKNYTLERDSLMRKYFSLNNADSVMARHMLVRVRQIDSAVLQYRAAFIKKEKPTFFTITELFFLRNDLPADSLKTMLLRFPQYLQNTKEGGVVSAYVNNKKPEIGHHFIGIEGQDVNGSLHKLSDIKGKYVLLEFWASWCGPCRQENPVMVKTYSKYHPKGFEIWAFSTDANKQDWIGAIKKDGLTWINVSDLKGFFSGGAASYQVRAIPQNFLIGPDGIIIAKNLRGDDLAARLKAIYNE